MNKVDVLMSSNLDSIIGPVRTIKRINNNHDFFSEKGFDITIFTNDNLGKSSVQVLKNKDTLIIKWLKKAARWIYLNTYIFAMIRIYLMFRGSKPLLDFYQKQKREPDMIVFHSIMDCYMFLRFYRNNNKKVKISLFTHSDGMIFKMLLIYFPKLRGTFVERKLMRIADYVMSNVDVKPCIAHIEEKNLLDRYPQLKGKTCLVINGIDDLSEEEFKDAQQIRENSPKVPPFRLVCAGSINGRKGQRIIIEALYKLNPDLRKDIKLTLIGDGPERMDLERIVKDYALSDHVVFTGSIANNLVYKELAKANIYILMSENEGLPIGLIEGLRSGLPLISTRVSGIPELIEDDSNGVLINPDVDELVTLMSRLYQFDWETMGGKSRELFEHKFEFKRMRQDYLNMLKKGVENA